MAERFNRFAEPRTSSSISSKTYCTTYHHCSMYTERKCTGWRPREDFIGKTCKYYTPLKESSVISSHPSFPSQHALQEKQTFCSTCGAVILENSSYCIQCGQKVIDVGNRATYHDLSRLDARVYDYIVQRNGEISLSKACEELELSPEQIQASFDRLKRAGKIS